MSERAYVGDSVYAHFNEAGQLVLETDNGLGPTNTIYIEPEVWLALLAFVKAHYERQG